MSNEKLAEIRKLAVRLQTAAYDHGGIDASDRWSAKKYADADDRSMTALTTLMDKVSEALQAHAAQAQPPANTERLAELLRGLEIGPMAAMLSPKKLFAIGAAIAAQAKEAQPPAASLTFATPETEEDVMAYLRIAKLHIKRFREILQAALAAQENPNG